MSSIICSLFHNHLSPGAKTNIMRVQTPGQSDRSRGCGSGSPFHIFSSRVPLVFSSLGISRHWAKMGHFQCTPRSKSQVLQEFLSCSLLTAVVRDAKANHLRCGSTNPSAKKRGISEPKRQLEIRDLPWMKAWRASISESHRSCDAAASCQRQRRKCCFIYWLRMSALSNPEPKSPPDKSSMVFKHPKLSDPFNRFKWMDVGNHWKPRCQKESLTFLQANILSKCEDFVLLLLLQAANGSQLASAFYDSPV